MDLTKEAEAFAQWADRTDLVSVAWVRDWLGAVVREAIAARDAQLLAEDAGPWEMDCKPDAWQRREIGADKNRAYVYETTIGWRCCARPYARDAAEGWIQDAKPTKAEAMDWCDEQLAEGARK